MYGWNLDVNMILMLSLNPFLTRFVNTVKTLKKLGYAALRDTLSKDYLILLVALMGEI